MPTRLGQNFLKNKEIVEKIIQATDLKPDDFVIEVGAGKGILTEELLKKSGKVIAVEIDENLAARLDSRFPASPAGGRGNDKLKILNEDILKINLGDLGDWGNNKSYKVVANLPYYITSPIIRKFLEAEFPPSVMILMVQKEVAERIVASPREIPTESRGAKRISRGKPGKMSILAVSVQYYARPEILFYVGKENFEPAPEVDSAVIRITHNMEHGTWNKNASKNFFRIVRAGFSAKRKTLANNLASGFHVPKKEVEEKLKNLNILPTARAQELSVENWKKLAKLF
jgi:16S rRNA (adenine1518-N6/adenine1519-N6)-dimethyltransferase